MPEPPESPSSETWKEYMERMQEKYSTGLPDCFCNPYAGRHFLGCPYYKPETKDASDA
jgi:hypothetical protein